MPIYQWVYGEFGQMFLEVDWEKRRAELNGVLFPLCYIRPHVIEGTVHAYVKFYGEEALVFLNRIGRTREYANEYGCLILILHEAFIRDYDRHIQTLFRNQSAYRIEEPVPKGLPTWIGTMVEMASFAEERGVTIQKLSEEEKEEALAWSLPAAKGTVTF